FHAYSIVQDPAFIELMKKAEPRYTVPSRKYFSQYHIPNAYEKAVGHINSIIDNECKRVRSLSFATDGWTSHSNESYISLTVHYVTEEWKLRHITLNLEYFKDNAPNLVAAIGKVPDGYTWKHLRCVAHSLQLAIADAKKCTPNLEALLIACRSIVGHYKRSSTAKARLFELQKKENMSPPLMLIQDVKTRWNSEYLMLHRIYELKIFISDDMIESNIDPRLIASFLNEHQIENLKTAMKSEIIKHQLPLEPVHINTIPEDVGQIKYPYIKWLALQYLAIPATQVSSERLFSSAGQIVSDRRTLLLPEYVEQLLVLKDYYTFVLEMKDIEGDSKQNVE
ncbi:Ribonuclease H-like domain,HAT, C-terminal dimerisation domain, partial [Cinara cedri]